MAASPKTKLKIVFGAMTFGKENTRGARVHSTDEAAKIIDVFQAHGHNEIDTARGYGNGTSEEYLRAVDWQKRGLIMDTKLYPDLHIGKLYAAPKGLPAPAMAEPEEHYTHSPEDVRLGLSRSLKALNCEKVDMFYLHGPDRVVSLEDTLRTVNELHQKGLFNRFGISNFQSWEVARLVEICDRNRWVRPVVYQGIYNALHRSIEPELIPCLRHYGIQLYAFQPLAGGFLTGRYRRDTSESEFEPGSRFDPKIPHSALHRGRYWNEAYFDAIEMIHGVAENHGLTVAQVALRWLEHHSLMREGDAIIVGASSVRHTESNLKDLEGGELPEEVVRVVDEAWLKVKAIAPKYWH